MLNLKPLFLAIPLAGCCLLAQARDPSVESVQSFLIASSATDFRTRTSIPPVNVRDVRLGYIAGDDGDKVYMLCGQVQSRQQDDTPNWIDFATVRTEDYEQWIGDSAVALCQNASPVPGASEDLSSQLRAQLTGE